MNENEISKIVVDAGLHVHRELGPGLLETVYEVVLAHELRKRGLRVERQVKIPIVYDGITFDEGYRADLLVEETVLVEVKSVEALSSVHGKQVLTQLRLTKRKLGLLLNFGDYVMKNGIRRIVNGLDDESPPTL